MAHGHELKIRLALNHSDVAVAQRLRFRIFHDELRAPLSAEHRASKREYDRYDEHCDHLLVIDPQASGPEELQVGDGLAVGTYRMLRQDIAIQHFGFYSANEFAVGELVARWPNLKFVEVGRSCILKPYRSGVAVGLLWQGIWNYVRQHGCDVMLGCASFEGTDIDLHRPGLRYLAQKALAPAQWQAAALANNAVHVSEGPYDEATAFANLPALIKGYLRLGGFVAGGAVIDPAFNTTDVLVVLPIAAINPRYFARFGAPSR